MYNIEIIGIYWTTHKKQWRNWIGTQNAFFVNKWYRTRNCPHTTCTRAHLPHEEDARTEPVFEQPLVAHRCSLTGLRKFGQAQENYHHLKLKKSSIKKYQEYSHQLYIKRSSKNRGTHQYKFQRVKKEDQQDRRKKIKCTTSRRSH